MKKNFSSAIIPFRFLFLLLILGGLFSPLYPQDQGAPYIRNYKSREYQASSANYAIAQDGRGIMYFGNYRGVLEYDGTSWRLITVENHTMVRSLATDDAGQVYVGALGEFGYLAPDSLGTLRYYSLKNRLETPEMSISDIITVIGLPSGAVFRSTETGRLFFWEKGHLRTSHHAVEAGVKSIYRVNNRLLGLSDPYGLVEWNGESFVPLKGGEPLAGLSIMSMVPFPGDKILLKSFEKGFFLLSFQGATVQITPYYTEADRLISENMFTILIALGGEQFFIGTVKGGGLVIDREGKVVRYIDESAGLQDNLVLGGFQDRGHSLWLALSRGISRVEIASPLSHWNEDNGLQGLVFSTVRHKGTLYASTPLGVYYLKNGRFFPVENIEVEAWKLITYPVVNAKGQVNEKLLVATVKGVYEISGNRGIPADPGARLTNPYQSPWHPEHLYNISGTAGVQIMEFSRGRWQPVRQMAGLTGRYKSMAEDQKGNLWLVDMLGQGELYRVDFPAKNGFSLPRITPMTDSGGVPPVLKIYHLGEKLIFSTAQGLYLYNETTGRFYADTLLNLKAEEGAIIRFQEDHAGNVWVERQSKPRRWLEVVRRQPDGTYLRDTTLLKGLANTEIWGNIYPEPTGLTWIGTQEGLYVYDTRKRQWENPNLQPLIREVSIAKDSVLYFGAFHPIANKFRDSIKTRTPGLSRIPLLNYKHNSIVFHYTTPWYQEESPIQYSYWLKNWESNWGPWTGETRKEYNSLPPGEYEFQVRAKNIYGEISSPAIYHFKISPPWYRTFWAILCYGCLFLFLIYGTVKLNTRRLHLQNENLERVVYERTSEIWDQHKEIVKKTVALKRQKEEIAAQHALLEEKNETLENTLAKLKETQSQLVDSEKMASLGQLTAGIAHEINNPINFVKGNINPLKKDFEEIKTLFELIRKIDQKGDMKQEFARVKAYCEEIDANFLFEEMEQLLDGIEEGAVRTKEIVDGLKIFARSDLNNFKHVDIHSGIDATLTLLGNKLKDHIRVDRHYAELPVVECMPGKLNQVFMNILTNAIQAIEEKAKKKGQELRGHVGTIAISTEMAEGCHPEAGGCLRIRIKDDGPGMTPEVKSRIFDPFFTTKDVGEGTGLGLSITFGIIENHKGTIQVNSTPGEGTEFVIILPFKQQVVRI
ncbi:MAG: ATP-binding protein [Bacteroidia bacterium]|nr:ATP-binding protein [Bacteroidia bacterium]